MRKDPKHFLLKFQLYHLHVILLFAANTKFKQLSFLRGGAGLMKYQALMGNKRIKSYGKKKVRIRKC